MGEKEELLRKLNDAFANCNTQFLANSVTNDILWKIVGEKTISGKKEFEESLEKMRLGGPMKITIEDITISDEKSVVEGMVEFKIEPGKLRKYAFCDIYIFSETDERKFRELRTYVTQIKKA
ncbi:MAG: nuclear transport factor 2 family protein [Christiangramia sp.]